MPMHLLRVRVVDQRLRLAAPAERVPHRRGGTEHGAGGVDGVAAALEHHRAGGGSQGFAGDSHPVASVQYGLACVLGAGVSAAQEARDEAQDGQKRVEARE
jgi:hypothetical protein